MRSSTLRTAKAAPYMLAVAAMAAATLTVVTMAFIASPTDLQQLDGASPLAAGEVAISYTDAEGTVAHDTVSEHRVSYHTDTDGELTIWLDRPGTVNGLAMGALFVALLGFITAAATLSMPGPSAAVERFITARAERKEPDAAHPDGCLMCQLASVS